MKQLQLQYIVQDIAKVKEMITNKMGTYISISAPQTASRVVNCDCCYNLQNNMKS